MGIFDDAIAGATAKAEEEKAAKAAWKTQFETLERDVRPYAEEHAYEAIREWLKSVSPATLEKPEIRLVDSIYSAYGTLNGQPCEWHCRLLLTWSLEFEHIFAGEYVCHGKTEGGWGESTLVLRPNPADEEFEVWIRARGEWKFALTTEEVGSALIGRTIPRKYTKRGQPGWSEDFARGEELRSATWVR